MSQRSTPLAGLIVAASLSACGGGSGSATSAGAPPVTTTYAVGGTLVGLPDGAGVALTNNGGDTLNLTTNGTFQFPNPVTAGSDFAVLASTGATSGVECGVSQGSGRNVSAAVTSVLVTCSAIIAPTRLSSNFHTIVWQDNFSSDTPGAPNGTLWAPLTGNGTEYGITGWGNDEAEYYLPANGVVANGTLEISGKADGTVSTYRCANGQLPCAYSSARLTSLPTINLSTPGFLEISAVLPTGTGSWPALWLLPGQSPGATFPPTSAQLAMSPAWPAGGEVDIVEYLGAFASPVNGVVQSTLHLPLPAAGGNQDQYEYARTDVGDGVNARHLYQLLWTASSVQFAVDDAIVMTCAQASLSCNPINPASPVYSAASVWPYGTSYRQYYLLMNLAIGGNAGIALGDNTRIPANYAQVMQVSYVRYLTP